MKAVFSAIVSYLKDWRNLLTHALIGVGILVITVFLPVPLWIRLSFLGLVVIFNIIRMRLAPRKT